MITMLAQSSSGHEAISDRSEEQSRRVRLLVAVLGPPLLGVVFIPVFRMISRMGMPTGSLEGIDLTRFAERDQLILNVFEVTLLLFALVVGGTARTWSSRLTHLFVAALAGLVTMAAVFVALMAG